ncbi:MAG: response regulator [Cyanobacteria bacterium J06632_3]
MAKVLVIEDETEIRANLLELLEFEGYNVIGASNGAIGLIGALEYRPDIILCDVMMPELDGHDVLAALRQEPETALTPFIFLTALADKGDIRKGMTLGADDYITKPFTCAEVIGAISTRLEKQAALTAREAAEQAQIAALQQEVKDFRNRLNDEHAALIYEVRSQLKASLHELRTVNDFLNTLPAGTQREQNLLTIQSVCAANVKLLTKIPNFDYLSDNMSSDATGHIEQTPTASDPTASEPTASEPISPSRTAEGPEPDSVPSQDPTHTDKTQAEEKTQVEKTQAEKTESTDQRTKIAAGYAKEESDFDLPSLW